MTENSIHNREMQLADDFVCTTGCNIFLTGKAGTGKTTFLHNLQKKSPKRMIVTAPTGVAAINAGGVTLHSFFQMPFGPIIPGSDTTGQHRFNREKIKVIKGLDLLVIDEISMVRADLLDGIDSVLRRYRRSSRPFGGVQLLCIGDLYQLPPVVKGNDWQLLSNYYESPYFFSSRAMQKSELVCIELQHIYRQADNRFIELLNQVRNNHLPAGTLDTLNRRYQEDIATDPQKTKGYITLCTHNNRVDSINSTRLGELRTETKVFKADVEGEFPEYSYPTAASLELKVGAQVMFVRNDISPEKLYFNGKIGKVTRISPGKINVKCPEDAQEITVEPSTWENMEYSVDPETQDIVENKVGSFNQIPLKLAWAITIHKSQGLTFDKAIIDAEAAFAHGQVYVALSRCRSLDGLILSSLLSPKAVRIDSVILQFVNGYTADPVNSDRLNLDKIRYEQELLLDCFDFSQLQGLLSRMATTLQQNSALITVSGGDYDVLRGMTVNEICRVGTNFRRQLSGYFDGATLPSTSAVILERLNKASQYFQEKIIQILEGRLLELDFGTDNKEIRKKIKNLIDRLQVEAVVKKAGIASCEDGFSTSRYLRAVSSAEIQAIPQKKKAAQTTTYSEADVEHPELFHQLKQWRTDTSKKQNLAPFQVLHQKTLVQIAALLPDTLEKLGRTRGIGPKLLERYGEDLIGIVRTYRENNNITVVAPPEKKQLETEPGTTGEQNEKTDSKQQSLDLLKQGLSPVQIAEKRGLAVSTIEGHLTHFVATGALPIGNIVDNEKRSSIELLLNGSPEKKLGELKRELGPGYSYGEIKLVMAHLKQNRS
jgi:hypothetical protein